MTRFLPMPVLLLALALVPLPAAAQMSPPPGVLTLPKKKPSVAEAPVTPPEAAPVTPVEQVAPFATPRAPAAPAKPYVAAADAPATPAVLHKLKRPTPVVHAPPHVHAQRPEGVAPAAGKPAPTPAPVVAAAAPVVRAMGSVTNLPLPRWASSARRRGEPSRRPRPAVSDRMAVTTAATCRWKSCARSRCGG